MKVYTLEKAFRGLYYPDPKAMLYMANVDSHIRLLLVSSNGGTMSETTIDATTELPDGEIMVMFKGLRDVVNGHNGNLTIKKLNKKAVFTITCNNYTISCSLPNVVTKNTVGIIDPPTENVIKIQGKDFKNALKIFFNDKELHFTHNNKVLTIKNKCCVVNINTNLDCKFEIKFKNDVIANFVNNVSDINEMHVVMSPNSPLIMTNEDYLLYVAPNHN